MTIGDAHIHFFRNGYHRPSLPSLFGGHEVESYEALRQSHGIGLALAIGYEADGIDPGNNAFLRSLATTRPWLKTLAFVPPGAAPPTADPILDAGHCGIAVYVPDRAAADSLCGWPDPFWQGLDRRRAIVSLNARPATFETLRPLLARWTGVTFLFSHLGLPGLLPAGETAAQLGERFRPLLSLADLPNVCVKISGLYATSEPSHAFPHPGAAAAIAVIIGAFGAGRCLWASDYAPALEYVSFPQTIDWPMQPDLSQDQRLDIMGRNLARIVDRVVVATR